MNLFFLVKQVYKFNESGMVLDFLWNSGCTSLNPCTEPNISFGEKAESERLCYHGPPSALMVEAYEYLYEQFKNLHAEKVRHFELKRVEYNDANFGVFSKKIVYKFLLDPSSEEYLTGE